MELDDLSSALRRKKVLSKEISESKDMSQDLEEPIVDNAIALWAYAKAIWLVILSLPLLLFPRFLLFLSSTNGTEHRDHLTPLEGFLATHFGILLFSLAVGILVSMPSGSPVETRRDTYSYPLLLPLTCGSLLTAFLSYNTPASQVGSLAIFVAVGAGGIGVWGVWAFLFAGSSLISQRTGADKRTSRFLFNNRSAAGSQKKRWKKEHEAGR